MSTKANYGGSVCGLCEKTIAKGTAIVNFENKWCHETCVLVKDNPPPTVSKEAPKEPVGSSGSTDWKIPTHEIISAPSPGLTDFVYQENMLLIQIEGIITEMHKQLGLPSNGQQIGMHTREIYLQAKKTNLLKASQIK